MDTKAKLLIIEDEELFQCILRTYFESTYDLCILDNGEAGIEKAASWQPDLIILDINLPGIDGYQTCAALKENPLSCKIPVLFLSRYQGLDDRLKAYGVGGDDYLGKPFEEQEITHKVQKIIAHKHQRDQLANDLQSSYATILKVQSDAAKIQNIGRFLQNILFCHDLNSLAELFFKTTQQIGVSCVLYIRGDAPFMRSSSGGIHKLEKEILEMSASLSRIYSFGQNRAIFNWTNFSVLLRNLDDNIDIFAMLMNGLESGIQAINTERKLLGMLLELKQNQLIEDNIADLFETMNTELKHTFLSLGLISSLTPDEEDRINDKIESFHQLINQQLSRLSTNNQGIISLLNEMCAASEELAPPTESSTTIDEITFF